MKKFLSPLLLIAPVFAQEVYKLQEVTTTATREKEKLTTIPVRVDSVPEEEIKLDRPNHPKDDLNSLPGVLITQVAASLGHATAIRLPINYGPYYLYLQDGIPVQSSGFFNHNALWWTSWESSAGKIDVLKGVGTAIYGSDAIGAVINIESEKPSKKLTRNFYLEGGSYGYIRLKGKVSNTNEKHAYLTAVSYSQADGWREKTDFKRGEVLVKDIYNIDSSSFAEISFIANKLDAKMAGYLDYETFKSNPENSGLPDDLDNPYRKVDMVRISIKYNKELTSDSKIRIIPYLRYNRNRYVATWIPQAYPERDLKTYTGGFLNQYIQKYSHGKLILGFDIEGTEAKNHYFQTRPTVTIWGEIYPQGDIYKYDVSFYNLAPYIHNIYRHKKLTITTGLRYDYVKYDYDNKLSVGNFGIWKRPNDRTDSFNHLSPKFGLVYKINKENSIFGRYAHGFRIPQAGSLYELKKDYQETGLNPEKADSFEIGYKANFINKGILLNISAYYMEVKDKIITVRENSVSYRTNAGKTRHKGIEIGGEYLISEDFKLRGSYSISKHEYVSFKTGNKDYSGKEMSMAPRNLANIRLIYNPFFEKKLTAEFEYQHVGSYYMDDENTKKYDGYDIFNFKAQYKVKKNFKIFAKVYNITDKLYAETANIAYGRERYRPGMPRTIYAGIDITW